LTGFRRHVQSRSPSQFEANQALGLTQLRVMLAARRLGWRQQVALVILPGLLVPWLNSPATLAAEKPSARVQSQDPAPKTLAEPAPSFVLIKADQQGYDQQLNRFVATGNVEAQFNGWLLQADRVEIAERSRSVYVSGQVRLSKGDQYLQASRLRYSELEGSGELDAVYGVIDQDTLMVDQPTVGPKPSFACPELVADPGKKSLIRLIPPGRTSLPTMPPPAGCPGSEFTRPVMTLNQALESVAFGPLPVETPAQSDPIAHGAGEPEQLTASEQRVRGVTYQQSWGTQVKLNLDAVIDTNDSLNNAGYGYRPPSVEGGKVSRIRFQGSQIKIQEKRWTAEEMAFTNDPFTPAASWSIVRKVVAVMDDRGVTKIKGRRAQILLDGKVSLPAIVNTTIGEEEIRWEVDTDNQDRDGFYVGYNLDPIKLGRSGSLRLQPQLMLQRAFEGRTNSYVLPGESLASPTTDQPASLADMFGLLATLNLPMGWLSLNALASLSTFNPDNFRSGTRSTAQLSAPLGLPGHNSSSASLFGSYRERIYNGSLGLQTVVYSYGANLAGNVILNRPKSGAARGKGPFFQPVSLNWAAQSGNYQATLFETNTLDTLWRSYANLAISSTLQLWQGTALDTSVDPSRGFRYSPSPSVPGLGLDLGVSGYAASYSDGASQNTLTLWGGPALTIGQFDKPFFDYTRLSTSIAGTFLNGASPFGFDRTVDLRTLTFQAAQQIYGPLVIEAGATFNIDNRSEFYGDISYSYVELKLKRRSYELGVFYSPYDGIGGIRVKLNDFNFAGTGAPFVPRPRTR
jgi:hypothetical protein